MYRSIKMHPTLNERVWHQYHKQESGTTKLQSSFLGLNVTSIRRMQSKMRMNITQISTGLILTKITLVMP